MFIYANTQTDRQTNRRTEQKEGRKEGRGVEELNYLGEREERKGANTGKK